MNIVVRAGIVTSKTVIVKIRVVSPVGNTCDELCKSDIKAKVLGLDESPFVRRKGAGSFRTFLCVQS